MGTKQNGKILKKSGTGGLDYYGVIRGAIGVGVNVVLIEHSFHTQTRATNWLLSDANLDKLARAEVDVIAQYYGIKKPSVLAPTPTPTPEPFNGTKIMGAAKLTANQMAAYLIDKNPSTYTYALDYASMYIMEGATEGVRGDVAFAQSCLETGDWKFGGDVKAAQNNFAGIGAVGGGAAGNSFVTPKEGIKAQIQHLKAYASTQPLKGVCVDPRFKYVEHGCAEYVEWLGIQENPKNKGWASGKDYGSKIVAILEAIKGTKAPSIVVGSKVKIKPDAVYYDNGKPVASWVLPDTWIVASISGARAVVDKNVGGTHAIKSPIDVKYLELV